MTIAIFTFHRAYNQGAILQAYALSQFLKSLGHEVEFPDCNNVGAERTHFPCVKLLLSPITEAIKSIVWYIGSELLYLGHEDLRRWRFRKFVGKHLHTTHAISSHQYDCAIYGSDQIWNSKLTGCDFNLFLGKDNFDIQHRIAYAASIGDAALDPKSENSIRTAAQFFDAISTREPLPFNLRDKYGRPTSLVTDPTLLIPRAEYDKVAYPKRLTRNQYIFVYLAKPCPEAFPLVRHIADTLHLKVVCVDVTQRGLWRKPKEVVLTCSPDRFLAYIRDAEFVITNSFHGTALSIIYEKQFASIPATGEMTAPLRVANLLRSLNLDNRITRHNPCQYETVLHVLQTPLPHSLGLMLRSFSENSREWLTKCLNDIIPTSATLHHS